MLDAAGFSGPGIDVAETYTKPACAGGIMTLDHRRFLNLAEPQVLAGFALQTPDYEKAMLPFVYPLEPFKKNAQKCQILSHFVILVLDILLCSLLYPLMAASSHPPPLKI